MVLCRGGDSLATATLVELGTGLNVSTSMLWVLWRRFVIQAKVEYYVKFKIEIIFDFLVLVIFTERKFYCQHASKYLFRS